LNSCIDSWSTKIKALRVFRDIVSILLFNSLGGDTDMPRFIVTHDMTHCTQEQLLECTKSLADSLTAGTEWVQSWWVVENNKLLCEWLGENADAIRAALEPAGGLIPIESICEVQWIDPTWLK
jgi:hypothetical protein